MDEDLFEEKPCVNGNYHSLYSSHVCPFRIKDDYFPEVLCDCCEDCIESCRRES